MTPETDPQRFRAAFEKALIGMAMVRPDGCFLEVNPALCEMLGYEREELLELRFVDVTHPEDREQSEARFQEMLEGAETDVRFEKRYVRQDGGVLWVLLSSHLVRDDAGQPLYFNTQIVDVSERKLFDQSRNDFLATMSHGIRTPLNGILGMSRLLVQGQLAADERRHAEIIHSSAESLLRLIDELLDLSKVEAGQLSLETEDFRLREVVRDTVELLVPRAKAKRLDLRFTVSEETPEALRGDPHRLRQVLLSLLGNGIKFTRRGFVFVSVAPEPPDEKAPDEKAPDEKAPDEKAPDEVTLKKGDGRARIRFSVRDTGIGVAPELLSRIFEPFAQGDRSATQSFGGNGLGLAISKRLVEAMGGEIGVESTPEQGSLFWFSLPFETAGDPQAAAAPAEEPAVASGRRRESCRILVAEDDEVNRVLALRVLADAGYQADAAHHGFKVLEALEERTYDLILMDCQMPELDGYEATRLIRQLEKGQRQRDAGFRHIPIIAVTARTMKMDREKCAEAGMDDFVAKPYRAEELIRIVDRHLGIAAAAQSPVAAPKRAPAPGRAGDPPPGVIDAGVFEQLREFASPGQDDVVSNLIETFLNDKKSRSKELREAFTTGENVRLAQLAHKLISASGTVGAYRLAKFAGELEIRAKNKPDDCRELLEQLEAEYEKVEAALREIAST